MSSGFNLFKNWIDITPTQVWQFTPVSVADLVPDNATGVILRFSNHEYLSAACARRLGSSVDPNWFKLGGIKHVFAFCGLVDLKFEVFRGESIKMFLCGYTDEAVGFLAEPVQTTRCESIVPSDATGGIWLVICHNQMMGHPFNIKGYGSTDRHYNDDTYGMHATHISGPGGEANSFVYALVAFGEGKRISFRDVFRQRQTKPYLLGYTKPPVHFFLNSILKSPTQSNNWHKLDTPELPTEADGVILEIRNTAPGRKALSIREPGSVNSDEEHSYLGLETAMWGACGIAEGGFETWASWKERAMFFIHGYTVPAGTPQVFPCPHCPETFPTQEELNQHILSEHTFPCQYCSQTFVSQEELDSHIASEHNFPCPHCPEVFTSQAALDDHIQQNHTFPCSQCDEVFTTQQELDDHIASVHPQPSITITIESGTLKGTATIIDGHISMDIDSGHIEGEIS